MNYFKTCIYCGAHLDPGETCDCKEGLLGRAYGLLLRLSDEQLDRIMRAWEREAAPGAENTEGGRVEQVVTGLNSTSTISEKMEVRKL